MTSSKRTYEFTHDQENARVAFLGRISHDVGVHRDEVLVKRALLGRPALDAVHRFFLIHSFQTVMALTIRMNLDPVLGLHRINVYRAGFVGIQFNIRF